MIGGGAEELQYYLSGDRSRRVACDDANLVDTALRHQVLHEEEEEEEGSSSIIL
jgi:hypothetical protein